jgi:molybdopterin molybdotransferase
MLSVEAAQGLIYQHLAPLSAQTYPLSQLQLGQILAEEITSEHNSPPYSKALMDGFAVRSDDLSELPKELTIIEEIAAGAIPQRPLLANQIARIFTGAPIPEGCDAVVPYEQTETVSLEIIRFKQPVRADQFILYRGHEYHAGQKLLHPWESIQPEMLGLLASLGRSSVRAFPVPRVAILSTGNEVVEVDQPLKPGQIHNSNGPMLRGQVLRAGGIPVPLGIAGDDSDSLRERIESGLEQADMLLLAGGVSAGKFDLVPGVLESLGVQRIFHKIRMKPGKPLYFGLWHHKPIFGLPGNPVSSFVCFELFVRMAIARLKGNSFWTPSKLRLPLSFDLMTENDRPTYLPARVQREASELSVQPLSWLGSADLAGIRRINALIEVGEGKLAFPAGQRIETILLDTGIN